MNNQNGNSTNNNILPDQTLDPTTQRKHAAMIQRLSNLHQSRVSTKTNPKDPSFESTESFLSLFTNFKQSIESSFAQIQENPDRSNQDLTSDLEKISLSISELEKLVAENSYFLPSYEVRSCLKTISDLKQTLDSVTSKVKPRKKFSFKNKNKNTNKNEPANKSENKSNMNTHEQEKQSTYNINDSPGFRSREKEVLCKEFKDLEIGEFVLSDLTNCEVRLKGCFRTLFMNRLKNCKIYVGPVLGSILIEEVEGCLFLLASHQIRVHHAKGSDFYLRCRSRPIIEQSFGVRFAPYCLSYDGINTDLKESNLDDETGNWANVDDFQWLRAVQSPNWSILPENERVDSVKI